MFWFYPRLPSTTRRSIEVSSHTHKKEHFAIINHWKRSYPHVPLVLYIFISPVRLTHKNSLFFVVVVASLVNVNVDSLFIIPFHHTFTGGKSAPFIFIISTTTICMRLSKVIWEFTTFHPFFPSQPLLALCVACHSNFSTTDTRYNNISNCYRCLIEKSCSSFVVVSGLPPHSHLTSIWQFYKSNDTGLVHNVRYPWGERATIKKSATAIEMCLSKVVVNTFLMMVYVQFCFKFARLSLLLVALLLFLLLFFTVLLLFSRWFFFFNCCIMTKSPREF